MQIAEGLVNLICYYVFPGEMDREKTGTCKTAGWNAQSSDLICSLNFCCPANNCFTNTRRLKVK